MKLSVILPVLNEQASIEAVLTDLLARLRPTDEVIVVDGGSDDDTCHIACRQAQVMTSAPGRAVQMNTGASVAAGDVLLFLHADTVLPTEAIRLIETAIEQGSSWGRFDVRLSGQRWPFRVIERMMNFRSCITSVATGDQAIFVSRALFDEVNGYDHLPLMEDIALSKKCRKRSPAACIRTPLVTSSRRWESQGIVRTVLLMWWLRLLYFLGVSPSRLVEMYCPQHGDTRLLMIFAKAPVPGTVNTRLIPRLGVDTATALQRDLILMRMQQFGHAEGFDVHLYCAPDTTHELFRQCGDGYDIELRAQRGETLGERMANAMQDALHDYDKVVLVGTDAPVVDAKVVQQAIEQMSDNDVVIQPAEDGGYVLIAMRRFVPAVFQHIDWGSSRVMQQTEHQLQQASVAYQKLEQAWDIDTAEDYQRYLAEMVKAS